MFSILFVQYICVLQKTIDHRIIILFLDFISICKVVPKIHLENHFIKVEDAEHPTTIATMENTIPNFLSRFFSGQLPNCSDIFKLEEEEYILGEDGRLIQSGYEDTFDFCVDTIANSTGDFSELLLVCKEALVESERCDQNARTIHLAFTALGIVSLLFLLITFVVYVSVPELFNLHGKIIVANVFSIFMVSLYLIIVYNVSMANSILCVMLGYAGYFFSISMFGWMTANCLDLCFTFCNSLRITEDSPSSKFRLYSAGAWGLPTFLTSLLFAADQLLPEKSSLKPGVGQDHCFIRAGGLQRITFFHIPVLLLMVLNLILYIFTIHSLTKNIKETASVRQSRR